MKLGIFQIIGDHKRKSGKFDLGGRLYTPGTCNKNAYKEETENWWFLQMKEISRSLNAPRVECISANRTLFYFDDLQNIFGTFVSWYTEL